MALIDEKSQILQLEKQIEELPRGSISTKKVNNHTYYYHRWYEGKVKKERFLPDTDVAELKSLIEKRKLLQQQLKLLKEKLPVVRTTPLRVESSPFLTIVRRNEELESFFQPALHYKRRECFSLLKDYLLSPPNDKVFVIYGLRRTGKTTLIRQALSDLSKEMLKRTAFIQITPQNTLADVYKDLRILEREGYRYVFLDEVTLMKDFIDGAAVFSDVFAASGMKIILSGTDSLGFLFTEDEQLYDRCILIHTTFIPYREFQEVLGIQGIDEYIRYGGTMSLSGINYNEDSPFASEKNANEYVDTAIAHNIQHSLRYYQQANHFRNLQELFDKNELTSAINRVVEDQNHRFTLEVLTRDFESADLALSARNLRHDRSHPTNILDQIDIKSITQRLMELLEIRNRKDQSVTLKPVHAAEIQEYLALLDLIKSVDVVSMPSGEKTTRTLITQPGLRYAQAKALIESLLMDPAFIDLSITQRNQIQNKILSEIMGRMMEDTVLLETKLANPKKDVFVLQFAIGEFDMVVFDSFDSSCEIYEIKHSRQIAAEQVRHLTDEEKCRITEHRFGTIRKKYVIYRGPKDTFNNIAYLNVETYLCSLK